MLEHEPSHMFGVPDLNVDEKVLGAAQDEQLRHFGMLAKVLRHLLHEMPRTGSDADADERLQVVAEDAGSTSTVNREMTPLSTRERTRARQALGESPTSRASSAFAARALTLSRCRIARSAESSSGA